ncbi:MAG: hypothetical protein EPO08_07030 [Rhodospirillaceae bacterium]|nr:MAG: hypothetical protein EPO08_07030 [Rhodospirillaceae bacterium]
MTTILAVGLGACALQRPAPAPLPPQPSPPAMQAPTTPSLKPPPPKPRVPPEAHPEDITLIGLSRPEVTTALGDPQEQKDSNPGQTWIYRSGSCTVEILFLLDVTRNDDFVVDQRMDGTDGTPHGEQVCLRRIASHHGK